MTSDKGRDIHQTAKAAMEANRKRLSSEERQTLALEKIADQLEKIATTLTLPPSGV